MLCTQDDLEKLLQIDFGNTPDDTATQYIAQATAAVVGYCGQELEEGSGIVETHQANRDDTYLIVDRFPVTAVASVVEDGVTLTYPDDYRWYGAGHIRRVSGDYNWRWSDLVDAIVVTYTAGYATIPDDVVLATATIAGALFRYGAAFAEHGVKGIESVSLDGSDAITYAKRTASSDPSFEVGAGIKTLLAPYRRRSL